MSKHMPEDVRVPIEENNPSIMRIEEKCIKCGACKNVCEEYLRVHGTYNLADNNDTAICINCGQCANVCPTSSIVEKREYMYVRDVIKNKNKIVIFSTSPSVRVSLGEEFGLDEGTFVQEKMVGLLRMLGANFVLDTNFSADLTIMEEAAEVVERLKKGDRLPCFTSCCPAWVKYAEIYHPELLLNLSSTKSPIGMQGATVKSYFAKNMGLKPEDIVHVAVAPCTAKKMEIRRPEMTVASDNSKGMRGTDYVITTRELAEWAREEGISYDKVTPSGYDKLMGQASGGGYIFGNSGGVMEASLRCAYEILTGKKPPEKLYELKEVRGYDSVREATLDIGGKGIKVAVIYGTASAHKFIVDMQKNGAHYDFIEVMACPGGCIGGGGQPKNFDKDADEVRKARMAAIYGKDKQLDIKSCLHNPEIINLYENFYICPNSPLAKKMLHTTYAPKKYNLKK